MSGIHVGVIRGGISGEHGVSLDTGAAVLKNLPKQYVPVDVFIDKTGEWYLNGAPRSHAHVLPRLDVAFIALHGFYGEDGKIQRLLDQFGTPYTGSGAMPSAVGMNKALSKNIFRAHGLKTPMHTVISGEGESDLEGAIMRVFRTFPHPAVVKPVDGGSSIGVYITRDFRSFRNAIYNVLDISHAAMVEEHISGREATCGILDDFRGERYYALPPVEIIPSPRHEFFDYEAKYDGSTREICPSTFPRDIKNEVMTMARAAHESMGLRHYSRSDFIVSSRGVYILEVNTLPGLTGESLLPRPCKVVGLEFPEFLDHVLELALARKEMLTI